MEGLNYILDRFILKQLEHVKPPIKGDITEGKLTWRGIKLGVQDTITPEKRYFILQRGVEIGESIIL